MSKGGFTMPVSHELLCKTFGLDENCRILGIDYVPKSDSFEIHILTGRGNHEKVSTIFGDAESCWAVEGSVWNWGYSARST